MPRAGGGAGGEQGCGRIIKTARKLGISTVAVYSDADRDALHVEMADEAVHIGPPAAAQSYLLIDRIVDACRQTGNTQSPRNQVDDQAAAGCSPDRPSMERLPSAS